MSEKEESVVVTCVYCGHAYPKETPTHGASALTDHIKVCEKHPMRKLEVDFKKVRDALAGLVGVTLSTREELEEMRNQLSKMPHEAQVVGIMAVTALLETMP